MNHKLKTTIFKALDLLPNALGYLIYHKLQEATSKLKIEDKIKSTENSYNVIKKILSVHNIHIENKTIIEIGSGWAPILPYLLVYEAKVKKVFTYDKNKHYQKKAIKQLNKIFKVKYTKTNNSVTESILNENVEYFPYSDVTNGLLSDADLVISRFVLEHVSPKDIEGMHLSFSDKLKKGTYILHLISPSDHRAYSDKTLSLYDFLKYNQHEWDTIQTKFDYHNRLRLPQYLNIFKQKFA